MPDTEFDIALDCLNRLKAKYLRRGKGDLWDEMLREEFLRAFSLVPPTHWVAVTDEVLLNPPTDAQGRVNWLPDPADIVQVAKRMTSDGQPTASTLVQEVWGAVQEFGLYGRPDPNRPSVRLEGMPSLSIGAQQVVASMGGWRTLCTMDSPDSVTTGLLMKHAQNVVETAKHRPLLTKAGGLTTAIEGFRGRKEIAG